jgi:mutual gliding-motility protein MglA
MCHAKSSTTFTTRVYLPATVFPPLASFLSGPLINHPINDIIRGGVIVLVPAAGIGTRLDSFLSFAERSAMASLNYATREMNVKIVYYGPGLSGKTTNLLTIHEKTPPQLKSNMTSLATDTDRTIYFDFLPLDLGKIRGFTVKLHLYSVPGQCYYNATRKLVLRGVDGVVFVADSAGDKMDDNIESFRNLEENLTEYGYRRENIPTVIQYNKMDLPNVLGTDTLNEYLNWYHLPWTQAVANKCVGVFDTLKLISKMVVDQLESKCQRVPLIRAAKL